ncbi:MAG: peptide-methionine (R)-S-oxide reductase MsrB [Candidatus Paceibacterota bacterium]
MIKLFSLVIILLIAIGALIWGYGWYRGKTAPSELGTQGARAGEAVAYFAGGCFWCVESDYEKLEGVRETISGYMGGETKNPSYNQVASGDTAHRETVKVVYDPSHVSYRDLVLHLLMHSDPTDEDGSFYDRGHQYTSAVYYQTDEERQIAEDVIKDVEAQNVFGKKTIATKVEPAGEFWVAEDYHQDYYKENPVQYSYYRAGSGRDAFIESAWGDGQYDELFEGGDPKSPSAEAREKEARGWKNFKKPTDAQLSTLLTPLQYKVTQEEGTERPFKNEYWDNHDEGIYVDIISGEPLFSSTEKFDSGTGWPSFLKPIDENFVTEHQDYKLIIPRTEIRSRYADSHLGHIILDGPKENDRVRYCMNSAALRFVPKEKMAEEGYGDFLYLSEEA